MNDIGRVPCRNRFVMALLRENGICNIISIVIEVCSFEEEVLSGGPSLNSHESCVNVSKKEYFKETQPFQTKQALEIA